MATPQGPTGKLIGQQITVSCDIAVDDFYQGPLPADLTTEYDLTKGVNITFDGQLYKNVPAQFVQIGENQSFIIGEFANQQPILTTYPFGIGLLVNNDGSD